jgi:hypothetical protein
MQIDIVDDGIQEAAGENLRLTFTPVGTNYTFTGTTVYNIKINDRPNTTFMVDPTITGDVTGTSPNFEISEGQTFNLNFNADASAQNGTTYNPVITITQNGNDATANFTIDDLDKSFTVSGNDPDGSIQFVPNDDGNNTGDEVYTLTIGSENTGQYTIAQPTTFTITVTDSVNNTPFTVTPKITGDVTGTSPDFGITEGQIFNLNFNADASAQNGTTYNPVITITQNGNDATANFTIDDLDKSFTVSGNDPDGSIQFVPNDDGNNTGDEVYTLTIGSENTGQYTIAQPTTFTITVTDSVNNTPFTVTPTITGDVTGTSPNFEITEGQNFFLNFEASVQDQSIYSPTVRLTKDGEESYIDFNVNLPLSGISAELQNPDASLNFLAIDDGLDEGNEVYVLTIESNDIQSYIIQEPSTFQIIVKDKTEIFNSITAILSNIGGMESESNQSEQRFDEITLQLFDEEGNVYVPTETLTFNIDFNTENIENFLNAASPEDYQPEKNQFVIGPDKPTDTIKVIYPKENPDDTEHDYYDIVITGVDSNLPIDITKILRVKILDLDAKFDVNVTVEQVIEKVLVDNSCCLFTRYLIEEGERVKINFEAEKGVPEGTEFDVEFEFIEPYYEFNIEIEQATFGRTGSQGDFFLDTPTPGQRLFTDFSVATKIPDNFLEIQVRNNDENGENLERFAFLLDIPDTGDIDYNLIGDIRFEVVIEEPVFVTIQSVNGQKVAKENPLTSAAFEVNLNEASNSDITLRYQLNNEDSTATETLDFEELSGEVIIEAGETSELISIIPINDTTVEMDESVILKLIDGPGYALTTDNTAQITIESDDVASFEVSVASPDPNALENNPEDTAEIVFTREGLNQTPLSEALEVSFRVTPGVGNPQENSDWIVLEEDGETRIEGEVKKVTIPINSSTVSVFIQAVNDSEREDGETVLVALANGSNYSFNQEAVPITINLISEETLGSFNPNSITVRGINPLCGGDEQKGQIIVENRSGFEFLVVYKKRGEDEVLAQETLRAISTGAPPVTFDDVFVGSYDVVLTPTNNNVNELDGLDVPSFRIEIDNSSLQVNSLEINNTLRTLNMEVSGSDLYSVINNGIVHEFSFKDSQNVKLEIPLIKGRNQVTIRGKAECMGVFEYNLLFDQIIAHPNPTNGKLYFEGVSSNKSYNLLIYDALGRLVGNRQMQTKSDLLNLNISNLENGLFHVLLKAKNEVSTFKIVKQ